MRWRILIVDDEEHIRLAFKDVLLADEKNYDIDVAAGGEEAIVQLKEADTPYDIVLTDVRMGKVTGMELMKWIKKNQPQIDVVIITAHGDIEKAVEAMQEGATNYAPKPVESHRLRTIVRDICRRRRLELENRVLKGRIREYDETLVVGNSEEITRVYKTVERVSDTDATVLIQGESGTGKEVIARAIHHNSSRRKKPFVIVNCAALPATLLENELFGHEKEAFTGASSTRKGRFEQANGGTIFLDEITEMSLENQSRFLRVLEDGGFHRVGGSEWITVNVRIIAASNRIIVDAVTRGEFRRDLYYRLNVVPIEVPPLRQRRTDIPVLAEAFLREFSIRYNREELTFSRDTRSLLAGFQWPGNVRELRNAIERAVILSPGEVIQPQAFPELLNGRYVGLQYDVREPVSAGTHGNGGRSGMTDPAGMAGVADPSGMAGQPGGASHPEAAGQPVAAGQSGVTGNPETGPVQMVPGRTLQDMEREMIRKTLESVDGHRKKAAELLGISVRTLQYKIKDYDLK
ncbi:MAG TPA: sigma 54-interacting transcriptional regulator [bacterium]|nr:sigma 54-interacting transcriptional regulator [bacterium]